MEGNFQRGKPTVSKGIDIIVMDHRQRTYNWVQIPYLEAHSNIIIAATLEYYITVNREYFVVKIFSDSLVCTKIKHTKIHAQY